ncbi:MAG TPA: hypothetical protein PKD10_18250 [Paracoccaceae bacterium]|nr:hypothetical protein [Paracoccaceae bacterium]
MPLPVLRTLAFLAALAGPAGADIRDEVTALIRAGDTVALRVALLRDDPEEARRAFAAFDTAHPAADAASAALLAETPADPLALTARGWHLMAAGWALRGTGAGNTVYPAAVRALDRMHGDALANALAAVATDPGLVPASDLLLAAAGTTGRQHVVPSEFARIMALHPTRRSLHLAAAAMVPAWGGPAGWSDAACADWADRVADVEGYGVEICRLDMLFSTSTSWRERAAAFARLSAFDHPVLDGARRLRAMYGPLPGAEAEAELSALAERDALDLEAAEQLDRIRGQAHDNRVGPVTRLVLTRALPRLRAAVDFNPGDGWAVQQLVDALFLQAHADGQPVARDEIDRAFAALFRVAPYDGDTWARYGHMMDRTLDFRTVTLEEIERIRGFYVNGAFFTGQSAASLQALEFYNRWVWEMLDRRNVDAVDTTGTTAFAKDDYDRAVVCPAVGAIRLFRGLGNARRGLPNCPTCRCRWTCPTRVARARRTCRSRRRMWRWGSAPRSGRRSARR